MISGFVHRIQNSRKRNSKQMQAMERERQRTVEAGSQTQSVGQSAIDRTVTNNRMSKTEERKEEGMLGGRLYTSTERTKIGCSRWLQSSSASDDIDFPPDRSPPPASPPPPQCTGGWSAGRSAADDRTTSPTGNAAAATDDDGREREDDRRVGRKRAAVL